MKKLIFSLVLSILVSPLLLAGGNAGEADESSVKWYTYEEAVKAAQNKPKKIFIDVYTDWCGWCKKMDRSTFTANKVVDVLNKDFYAVKLNAESNKSIEVKGENTTPRAVARKFKVTAYPTTVYLDENQNLIQSVPGYQSAENLDMILNYFAGDYHKNTDWKEFQKSYQK